MRLPLRLLAFINRNRNIEEITMSEKTYTVGGLVRVDVENADESGLEKNAVVTITRLAVVSGVPVAFVAPGGYAVSLGNLTPVAVHDVLHPDDGLPLDVEEEESFDELVDLMGGPGPRLYGLSWDEAVRALELEDVKPDEVPTVDPMKPNAGGQVGVMEKSPYAPSTDDVIGLTDLDGDTIRMTYGEGICDTHGFEAEVQVSINDEVVDLDMKAALTMARWLTQRASKARDHHEDWKKKNGQ